MLLDSRTKVEMAVSATEEAPTPGRRSACCSTAATSWYLALAEKVM